MNQLPEIPVLETEDMWSQRAIDTPEEVLEELKKLNEQHLSVRNIDSSVPC